MKLDTNNHSVFLLHYHFVLAIRYRREVIDADVSNRLKEIFEKNAYKSASSRLIKKELPQIRKKLWKEYFWSRSYCLLTTGGLPIEVIKKYIQNQEMK